MRYAVIVIELDIDSRHRVASTKDIAPGRAVDATRWVVVAVSGVAPYEEELCRGARSVS